MVPARGIDLPRWGFGDVVRSGLIHRLVLGASAGAILCAAAACTPVRDTRGYVLNERVLSGITPGKDNRNSVLVALGTPSAIGTFQPNVWYYIGAQTEALAYKEPTILDQQVVAIQFNAAGAVADIQRYTLADGMKIDPSNRETPTHGREMGIMEQLLGNLGRFNAPAPAGGGL